MSENKIDLVSLQELVQSKVNEIIDEPEYNWKSPFKSFMTDEEDKPLVRTGVINCSLGTDIWEGLRTPAHVGMYPLMLEDIWRHYACMTVKSTRYDGSPNPLAMPETFEDAKEHYQRVVIIFGMLAVNPKVFKKYCEKIERGDEDPFDYYSRATGDVNAIINKAMGKVALSLMTPKRAVVSMTDKNTKTIIARTRSEYITGRYHGPCNNHWPDNSIGVMTGLLRFGVNRLPFRDEVTKNGKVQRLFGRYRSVVVFDKEPLITDNAGGIGLVDTKRLQWLKEVNDYTDTTADIVAERYCTYNMTRSNGESICSKCVEVCPSGALRNSTPTPLGTMDESLLNQEHRFWEGTIDFDYGNCVRERGQKGQLYDDYVCARCETICASRGIRKKVSLVDKINDVATQV